jgi:hypothetical protein
VAHRRLIGLSDLLPRLGYESLARFRFWGWRNATRTWAGQALEAWDSQLWKGGGSAVSVSSTRRAQWGLMVTGYLDRKAGREDGRDVGDYMDMGESQIAFVLLVPAFRSQGTRDGKG